MRLGSQLRWAAVLPIERPSRSRLTPLRPVTGHRRSDTRTQ
jgi:hypothetical protein